MDNIDSRWIKEILIAIVVGFVSGEIISKLLGLVLVAETWKLFLDLWVPACIIFALLYVLKRYGKEKEDTIE